MVTYFTYLLVWDHITTDNNKIPLKLARVFTQENNF